MMTLVFFANQSVPTQGLLGELIDLKIALKASLVNDVAIQYLDSQKCDVVLGAGFGQGQASLKLGACPRYVFHR